MVPCSARTPQKSRSTALSVGNNQLRVSHNPRTCSQLCSSSHRESPKPTGRQTKRPNRRLCSLFARSVVGFWGRRSPACSNAPSHRAGDAVSRQLQLQDVWLCVGTDMERATREASNLRRKRRPQWGILLSHLARHRRPSVDANADTGLARQLRSPPPKPRGRQHSSSRACCSSNSGEEHALAIQASRPLTTTMVVATPLIQQEVGSQQAMSKR